MPSACPGAHDHRGASRASGRARARSRAAARLWPFVLGLLIGCLGVPEGVLAQEPPASEQVTDADSRQQLQLELSEIDAQLAALEVERTKHPIDGPKALMVTGYVAGGVMSVATLLIVPAIILVGGLDDARKEKRVIGAVAGSAVGLLALGVGGHIWLSRARKRPSRQKIESLRSRRDSILQIAPELAPTSFGLRLSWQL